MTKVNYNVLGVMSGTSLDGIDVANISFELKNGSWTFQIHDAQTIPYSKEWIERLKNAVDFTTEELDVLNDDYTKLLASVLNNFILDKGIKDLDAVCSHGHTILHQPQNGFTLQIGNKEELARLIQNKVVCDFRVQDVKLGGQGAPLVPIGDRLLFDDYTYCLNLGGFSNISFEENGARIAFDISPVNTVLNYYAGIVGFDYDDRGAIAAEGNVIPELMSELNTLEFYSKDYPKSLGFEFVKTIVLPLMESYDATPQDKLRTFTDHVAIQIAKVILGRGTVNSSLLITGGGAYNDYLINIMKELLPDTYISIPDDITIQYKEALIFGLLGVLRLRGDINVLSSVTGAKHDHSSGNIFDFK